MIDLTLKSVFVDALDRFGDRPALYHQGRTHSYADIVADANRLAHRLRATGVGPGVAVALMMSNRPEYVVADQAILRCGAIKVPLNDMLSVKEIDYILRDSGARVAIADTGMLPAAQESSPPGLELIIAAGDECPSGAEVWTDALSGQPDTVPDVEAKPDDLGLIIYTGGTTGLPKGVMHTQRSLAVNLFSHVMEIGLLDDEVMLLMSPLPHSAGFHLQAGMLKGARAYLETKFDPELVLDRITANRVTFTFMVPTMIYRVLDRAAGRPLDLSSLRTILYGAAPITRERLEQGLATFGPVFMQLYGQSEAPNFITRLRREDHTLDPAGAHRLASCGQPVAMAQVAIVDDDGRELPRGEIGEVAARTPYTMVGYHNRPEQTAKTLQNGWLRTGDIGRMDEQGYVYLLDRKNDMIISGGMNVYSTEVENVAATCPGVAQVAVVGVPHPDWGEAVVAFVVPDDSGSFDEAKLLAHCRGELARYKQPKAIRVVESLPTTAYGKLDKKALRASWPGW
ncbi:class I adenylate-forming enzyme family protein [Pseudonocardia thermophila]|jgi:Acyl-CoA synthetases (AMP-forming)/AMP-acid ligases II|uniref:class I adenylate-forming enzyme family protein n=1 Tax=Pseudonocardia thermophila TaxID=1848 RepID=UPI00248DB4B9|nr:AMP-binding protein [Pseudonocardia thermophila]